MAKTVAEMDTELTAKALKVINLIKKPFTQFTKDFAALAVSREELAPKFMKAFGLYQAETAKTFVDFVRYLVPEVGKSRNEYRSHRAYQAADYLRRLASQAARGGRKANMTAAERANVPATPTEAVARVIASMLTLIPQDQQERVYQAVHTELHWSERQVTRLQNQVEHADPLVIAKLPRGVQIPALKLSFPEKDGVEEKVA